jgi:hypothetical protein
VTVETPEGEEHEVYLKASGSPELSVSGLAAEALAPCIAGRVGLPVCRPFLVDIADSDDAAHRFLHDAARRSDLMPPTLGRSVGG